MRKKKYQINLCRRRYYRNRKIKRDDPFKDQIITHKRRYYNETENNTLPEHYI